MLYAILHYMLYTLYNITTPYRSLLNKKKEKKETSFGSRGLGRSTLRQTCTSVVNHEDMDSSLPLPTKWEAHTPQLNSFPVQQNKRSIQIRKRKCANMSKSPGNEFLSM